jgi:RNHCP domain
MEPIAVTVRGENRWMLIHRCTRCGRLRMNRAAGDDNVLRLMQLAALPLATPPVPYFSKSNKKGAADDHDHLQLSTVSCAQNGG